MPPGKLVTLNQLGTGQTATVIQIRGGMGLTRRLEALGIRPGKKVTKVSSMLFRGPVSLKVDNSQIALGFGMASKITVEQDMATPGSN